MVLKESTWGLLTLYEEWSSLIKNSAPLQSLIFLQILLGLLTIISDLAQFKHAHFPAKIKITTYRFKIFLQNTISKKTA